MPAPPDGSARRRCGDCTLCCTVQGVKFDAGDYKPPGRKCDHVCSRGCRIYEARPQACREFACVWVQGGLPKQMRPDRVGMVFSVADEGRKLVGFWDTARPDLWRKAGVDAFLLSVSARGGESVVGPMAGKAAFRFVGGVEHARPPEADDYGLEIGVQFSEARGRWQVVAADGSLVQEFDTEGEAHAWAAHLAGA